MKKNLTSLAFKSAHELCLGICDATAKSLRDNAQFTGEYTDAERALVIAVVNEAMVAVGEMVQKSVDDAIDMVLATHGAGDLSEVRKRIIKENSAYLQAFKYRGAK